MLEHLEALQGLTMFEGYKLLIPPKTTVGEARKLLGRKYSHLSDDQITEMILTLTLMARSHIENTGSNNQLGHVRL